MNDHNLSLYILPVDAASKWHFLFEANDASSLHRAISRRPIHEPAFFTVYADPDNWLKLKTYRPRGFDTLMIKSHLISLSKAETIWRLAQATRDNHINFQNDMMAIKDRFLPIEVKCATRSTL